MDQLQEPLYNYFRSQFGLTANDSKRIIRAFQPVIIQAGQHFLQAGEKATSILFVVEGILRTHWINEQGNDITNFFFSKNQFLVALESYFSGQPSTVSIQAITDCQLLLIQQSDERQLVRELPSWLPLRSNLIQLSLTRKLADRNQLKGASAQRQYQHFVRTNGDIALRIPLQYIASYLGITPQSLSRIRRIRN